ncbi:MBL fold metallo-hydrolase [Sinomonas albida]|uniref:MBL fold metallo-hydrolase n=1 Tax=Sinomonas albida TaxID=369942 RepID=UPI0010A8DDB5|nr:MBL fold metallo-hydrolase [Sinomonas albida]
MTTIEFFGGIGVIGSSKIMVSTPTARVLLDMGLDIPSDRDLFRAPVRERPGFELRDRLAVGYAPAIPGVYDPAQLSPAADLGQSDDRQTAVFLSHAHLDHDGALGFLRPDIPVYAHPDTVLLEAAIAVSGTAGPGNQPDMTPITGTVTVGDITVEAVPVDHDIPGACGFLVTTPDGTLAYTGDLNFHRDGAMRSQGFTDRVAGVDMLVTETTLLSFDMPADATVREPRSEAELLDLAAGAMTRAPGLALVSMYVRDVDRARRLIAHASAHGRVLIWPGQSAALLHHYGVEDVVTWDHSRLQTSGHAEAVARAEAAGRGTIRTVSLDAVRARPSSYLVQPDVSDVPSLLDLPLGAPHRGPGTFVPFIHAQGEPLGPFMANWHTYLEWLDLLDISFVSIGSTGHATGEALHKMVADIHPGVVVPIHGFRPEALQVDVPRLLPEYGASYTLDGRKLS